MAGLILSLCPLTAAPLAAVPFPLANVTLAGQWAMRENANREILLSINATRWLCHFTTAANLTKCEAEGAVWHTYVKNATSGKYTHQEGFLSQGDDVKPPANTSFDQCEAFCTASEACLGITFQYDDPVPTTSITCYWKSALHFTPYKTNCIADGGAGQPVCNPLPGEMGLGGYYGHYQGHWLSATAFLVNSTGNATVRGRAESILASLEKVMDAWQASYGDDMGDGYLFPYSPIVWEKLLAGQGAGPYYSVPFYTLHKIMAGLLDQHTHARSAAAYTLLLRMASWVSRRVEATIASGGMELWQKVLLTEWGGMNDVMLGLYEVSGDVAHLATARRFNGFVFTAPLAVGHDDLAELPFPHANFHLPEIIGNAKGYELTGNATDRAIVRAFLDALTANHTYATGGSNSGECWQAPRDLGNFLSTQTEESCTQYNVLKVARHVFGWEAEPALADFYERAIENGIVGNQRFDDGALTSSCGTPSGCSAPGCREHGARGAAPGATSYIYMLPLGGAVTKPWGKSDYGFPCCWGTLSESFAKLGDSIYFASPDASTLFVNLFASSAVRMGLPSGQILTLEQTAHDFLEPANTSRLVVGRVAAAENSADTAQPATSLAAPLDIQIRVPGWLASGAGAVSVNGAPYDFTPGSFLSLKREWAEGDTIDLSFPPSLWTAPLNDRHAQHNATVAFMYGPLVLAGVNVTTDIFVPGSPTYLTDPASFITRVPGAALLFEAKGVLDGRPATVKMMPLRDVASEQYVVYFMAAGTKPPQPAVVYCPHSSDGPQHNVVEHGGGGHFHDHGGGQQNHGGHTHVHHGAGRPTGRDEHGHSAEEEAVLISAGPPLSAPPPSAPPTVSIDPASPALRSRGVEWRVDAQSGRVFVMP